MESLPPQLSALLPAHRIVEAPTPQTNSGKTLLEPLSFTHLAELIQIKDTNQRAFYETECIRVWLISPSASIIPLGASSLA